MWTRAISGQAVACCVSCDSFLADSFYQEVLSLAQQNNVVPVLWMEGPADILGGGRREIPTSSPSPIYTFSRFSQGELKTLEMLLARFHPVAPVPSRIQGPQIFIP